MAVTRNKPRQASREPKGSAVSSAYAVLREAIIHRLPPGSALDEEVFAQLGLSRTPAREALGRLAGERLVELLPNRGARVAPMGWKEVREHLEALDIIQRLVTRWAALRRTEADMARIEKERLAFEAAAAARHGVEMTEANWRFHTAIGASCRNAIFDRCYRQILTESLRIDRHAMFEDSFPSPSAYLAHVDTIIAEHRRMTEAIRAGDADEAEAMARIHTDLARRRIGDFIAGPLAPAMDLPVDIPREDKPHV